MINSQLFVEKHGSKGQIVMTRRGYLNLALVKGVYTKTGASLATPDQIGKDLSLMVHYCPWASASIPWAFARWKKAFGPFTPNWYLPVHLGGFGVDVRFAPDDWKVSRPQRLLAAKFVTPGSDLALFKASNTQKTIKGLAPLLGSWALRPTCDMSDSDYLNADMTDEWLVRGAYASQASCCGKPPRVVGPAKALMIYDRKGRFHPMSDAGLVKWWSARLTSAVKASCPPLNQFFPAKRGQFRICCDICGHDCKDLDNHAQFNFDMDWDVFDLLDPDWDPVARVSKFRQSDRPTLDYKGREALRFFRHDCWNGSWGAARQAASPLN